MNTEPAPLTSFGQRLKARRLQLGLTQLHVASAMGWQGNSRLANYETDRTTPTLEVIAQLARLLTCAPGDLAFGISETPVWTLPEWCSAQPLHISSWALPTNDPRYLCWAWTKKPTHDASRSIVIIDRHNHGEHGLWAVDEGSRMVRLTRQAQHSHPLPGIIGHVVATFYP